MPGLILILCCDRLWVVSRSECAFTCLLKRYSFADTVSSSSTPGYLVVAISVTAAIVVMVIMAVGIICFLRVRRRSNQRHKGQASSQVEMKAKEEFI